MLWSKLLGHDKIKKILQRAIVEQRVAHAYFLYGDDGVGKDAIAIEFAKTVNCEYPEIESELISYCGKCRSCKQFETLSHPNFDIVLSLPAGKSSAKDEDGLTDSQIEMIRGELDKKAGNYYYKMELPGANSIKVDQIRGLKKKLSLSGSQSGRRVVLITRADEMTNESANSFLKTLEEPQENVTIFLTTSHKDAILETILSRCQQISVPPLPDELITDYLIGKFNVEPEQALIASKMGRGSVTKSTDYLGKELLSDRDLVIGMIRSAMRKSNFRTVLLQQVETVAAWKDKNRTAEMFKLLAVWLSDASRIYLSGEGVPIVNIDNRDVLIRFAASYGEADYLAADREIEDAIKYLEGNVNINLVLINLFLKLRQIFLDRS